MARRKTVAQPVTSVDIFKGLSEALKIQAKRPNIFAYESHPKQRMFHEAQQKGRLYIGGNRSGKTTGGVVEDIWWARGQHPFRHVPEPPVRGRVVGVDFLQGIQKILLPEFQRWCPPSLLRNGSWEDSYNKELRTLYFSNDSFIEFMSYDQDTDKFAGTSRHFCHYDEEPPQHIFNECGARLIDTDGSWWLTMTPVEGMTWIFDTIYEPAASGLNPLVKVIEVDMLDNPYIGRDAAEAFLGGLSKDEREAREHGKFVQLGGRVFKEFSRPLHVIAPVVPPRSWEWYASMDHGYNNPTAWLWHAVSPDDQVITFSEHYAREMTVDEHAKIIHLRNSGFNRVPDVYVGDPAIAQRSGITGTSIQTEYMEREIPIVPGNNDISVGVARISTYLKPHPLTNKPRWLITEDCQNLIREMERLRWATFSNRIQKDRNAQDKIHKKDDHAPDAARYFFTMMPDLTPDTPTPESQTLELGTTQSYGELLAKMENQGTTWRSKVTSDIGSMEWDW
jgi:phage terminase large subunit-like protein